MTGIIVAIHVVVCIFLILVVLLQTGKGAEMGVSMGGAGSQALFGAAGPANVMTKITTGVAIIFMITSLTLAYMSGNRAQSSVMKDISVPVEQQTPEANE
ncbi:MAG: preprotein translocase subunit SecG [Desulfobacter postgatei]|uniref:Protein-export membrane protein SecG n=1 Tax=Desulfobacter postgatei TaxID=2293 RepID=A0A2G6MSE3_9BACT|nr:MAG: preprotein translocase subunit SecG [Desulfobacter postgatei]